MTITIYPHDLLRCRQASYRITGDGIDLNFTINSHSPSLANLMKGTGVTTAAYFLSSPTSADFPALQSIGGSSSQHGAGALALGISYAQAKSAAESLAQGIFVWVGSTDALPALKLLAPLVVPAIDDLEQWRKSLPGDEAMAASGLPAKEQAALMTVPDSERRHWLLPSEWNLSNPWPLTRPDGSTMNVGTELDRMFKLISAGLGPVVTEYVDAGEK